MPSYGDEVACPGCGASHLVRVGEINTRGQIEYACSCGGAVTMEHDGSRALVHRAGTRKVLKLNYNAD
jgi:lysyl-tRNA synthetase class I